MGIHTKVAATIGGALLCLPLACWSLTLGEAYRAALENDPYFRAAYHARQAGSEDGNIGLSHLLPEVSFSARNVDNRGRQDVRAVSRPLNYTSSSTGVYLRQPLLSLEKYAMFRQGESQAEMSEKRFLTDQQDAIVRIVSVYLDAVVAKAGMEFAVVQEKAAEAQYQQAKRMYTAGEAMLTDVDTAQTRLKLAEVQRVELADRYGDARLALAELTLSEVGELSSFNSPANTGVETNVSLDQAIAAAMMQNPFVQEKSLAVAVAEQNVNKAQAGYLPSLDLVASYSRNSQDSIVTIGQKFSNRSLGVEMQWPLSHGGQTSAMTRKAQAQLQQAQQEERIARVKAKIEAGTQHHTVKSALMKWQTLDEAKLAGVRNVEAMRQGVRLGVRTAVEVANAEKELAQTVYDHADAMRNYLLAALKLAAAMGELREDRVFWAEGYLMPAEASIGRR